MEGDGTFIMLLLRTISTDGTTIATGVAYSWIAVPGSTGGTGSSLDHGIIVSFLICGKAWTAWGGFLA